MQSIDAIFNALSQSSFRSQFKLNTRDLAYFKAKGKATTQEHGKDFIAKRLAPAYIPNDGKQTPMRGTPFLLRNMQPPLAAAAVYINGIRLHKVKQ